MRVRTRIRIAWRHRAWTKDQKVDRAFAGGLTMVAVGCGCVYWPLFFIVGGILLAWVAWTYGTAPAPAAALVDDDGDREAD
jgi:hypothetical protein